MAGLVTKETDKSVNEFIMSIDNPSKREDSKVLLSLMQETTGFEPKIWGNNFIIGMGNTPIKEKVGKKSLNGSMLALLPERRS